MIQSIYLSFIMLVSYVSGERMAFATYTLSLLILFIFLSIAWLLQLTRLFAITSFIQIDILNIEVNLLL